MNLLIVDDDKYVIEGVMNGVEWDNLPIDNVYTAIGTYQAKDIFLNYQIHILLCDIEIPNENGLSFVEWVRKQGFQTHVIFFTSYADFGYAQKAIQLNSFEYVLKPVLYEELANIILRAAQAVEKDYNSQKYQEWGRYWLQHQSSRNESFWSKLLTRQLPLTKEEVYHRVEKEMLGYRFEDRFMIVAADFGNEEDYEEIKSLELYSNKISHLLETLYTDEINQIETIWCETICRWYMVVNLSGCKLDKEKLRENGKNFLQINLNNVGKSGSLYFSEVIVLEDTYEQMERIKQMRFHNIGFREYVFFADEFKLREAMYQQPDMKKMELLMSLQNEEKAKAYIDEYLNYHARFYEMNEETLQYFMFDIMQLIFSLLRERQIEAHQLFADTKTRVLYEKASDSIKDMKKYVHYLIETSIDYETYILEPDNVINKIAKYIDDNLEQNITRADLAQEVYLNPDYMARLFKNEKGVSLVAYITARRMEKAKELLLATREPICVIATKTGFPSCSYFSKKFKEYYGVLPAEYKKSGEV